MLCSGWGKVATIVDGDRLTRVVEQVQGKLGIAAQVDCQRMTTVSNEI